MNLLWTKEKPTSEEAEKLVDEYGREVLSYNSGKFVFGKLQDARAALISRLLGKNENP